MATAGKQKVVLVVGKSGSGKSTLCNKIIGSKDAFCQSSSLLGASDSNRIRDLTATIQHSDSTFSVRIIDTAGFFQQNAAPDATQHNEKLVSDIRRYLLDNEIFDLNAFFVICKVGRFTPEEAQSLKILQVHFPLLIHNVVFVITHCEFYSLAQKEEMKQEFMENCIPDIIKKTSTAPTRPYLPIEKRIYLVGFPDLSENDVLDSHTKNLFERKANDDVHQLRKAIAESPVVRIREEIQENSAWEKFKMSLFYKLFFS